MSQFTVYKNKNPRTKKIFPLLLDIPFNLFIRSTSYNNRYSSW